MAKTGWTAGDIPDQSGRTAVVTGANSGIGLVTARELAYRGARVILACRSETRGRAAETAINEQVPSAQVEFRPLDLGDLSSVSEFAAGFPYERLDLLINNAGVMALPCGTTADGFETQFGVNHLGHFALTGLLLPRLIETPGARVVTLSSGMHLMANIDLDDLNSERSYSRWIAYGRSKSANLLFVHELARRFAAAGSDTVAAAAQPGYAKTNLHTAGVRMEGRERTERVVEVASRIIGQSAEAGALPTLYAATEPGVRPDSFTGPRIQNWRGSPTRSWRAKWTLNDTAGELLWAASEKLTKVRYDGLTS
ncbi:short-chain dehydrogenase [Streptomyces sp. 150FB]|uniref:oxidoreductase n=1 Tax=Streptomyces sp. 150FB TaxID=1576605 RepID=UPI0005893CE4|nr:oxidoreductase [Streptomyces sp. 150FB]KIF74340.1 short-chain dehydrogenase [Streptomyces sp. 150FB]